MKTSIKLLAAIAALLIPCTARITVVAAAEPPSASANPGVTSGDLMNALSSAVATAPESLPQPALQRYRSEYARSASEPITMDVKALQSSLQGRTVFIVETLYEGDGEAYWVMYSQDGSVLAKISRDEDGQIAVTQAKP